MAKKLEPHDLLKAIDFVTSSTSTADNFDTFSNSPIHILVYNEIKKFSKKELEDCTAKTRWYTLSDYAFKNSFLLSGFIEQGAFHDKLNKASQWIINSGLTMDSFLYETIYYIENDCRRKNRYPLHTSVENRSQMDNLFYFLCDYRPKNIFNLKLLEKYYHDFGKKDKTHILNYILTNAGDNKSAGEICHFFKIKLINDGFDFNSSTILNKLLPKNRETSKFFISSSDIPRLQELLNYGFRFDEKNYSYNGNNLFIAIAQSDRKDIIETIIPHLTDISPKGNWTMETQNSFIDNLPSSTNNDIIKYNYLKCKLVNNLEINNTSEKKIKI